MTKPPVHLSRQDLYAAIWSTPAEVLAAHYGISGRGLGKICARLLVPVPPRGWWAKKNAGHKVTRIPLPSPRPDTPQEVEIRATEPPPVPASLPRAVESQLVAVAHDPIPVPETLHRPHALVAVWLEEDRERARQYRDRGWGTFSSPYGTPLQKRALRILSALFKAIEGKGGTVDVKSPAPSAVKVKLNGQEIEFGVIERRQQVRTPLTLKERRESWNADRAYRQSLEPTGQLVFRIKTYASGARTEWKEKEGAPLEGLLPDILAGLIIVAAHLEQREIQRKEEERVWREEQQRRQEAQEKAEREAAKVAGLFARAAAWRKARDAEALVGEVERRLGEITDAVELADMHAWLAWARDAIAQRDPISAGITEVLNEVDDGSSGADEL